MAEFAVPGDMPTFAELLRREIDAVESDRDRRVERRSPVVDVLAAARLGDARAAANDGMRRAAKRRFRAQALATHPDRGGSAEAFRAAVRAFERETADLV